MTSWNCIPSVLAGICLTLLCGAAEPPVPAALFGQNFEHTRAMATGGLSAELVRTRKFAGIAQGGLALCAGRTYVVTAHLRGCFADEKVVWRLSLLPEAHCKPTTLAGTNATTVGTSWQTVSFAYASPVNEDAELRIEVKGVASGVVGAVSVLPTDHFHGMRRDVIAALNSETNRRRGRQ